VRNYILVKTLFLSVFALAGCSSSLISEKNGSAKQLSISGLVRKEAPATRDRQIEKLTHAKQGNSSEHVRSLLPELAGHPTALFFWASWCRICVTELPRINALADSLQKASGDAVKLKIFTVASLDSKSNAELAMRSQDFNVPVFLDATGTLSRELGFSSLPAMVLLDKNGAILSMLDPQDGLKKRIIIGPREWDDPRVLKYLLSQGGTNVE